MLILFKKIVICKKLAKSGKLSRSIVFHGVIVGKEAFSHLKNKVVLSQK